MSIWLLNAAVRQHFRLSSEHGRVSLFCCTGLPVEADGRFGAAATGQTELMSNWLHSLSKYLCKYMSY